VLLAEKGKQQQKRESRVWIVLLAETGKTTAETGESRVWIGLRR